MKKTCFLLLTVLLTTAALRASAQNKDTSKENFPSTETTLSQIGQAEAHPNARHVRMADTSALAAPVKRPGLIRRIIDYYSRSNVDRTFEKKIDWSIAPGPNYSSDVGFGIGFLLAGLYRLDRTDSVTAPSNISIYGNFTTEKFVLLRFSGDNIYNHNKQRLSYSGAFVYFPGAFYGVGYNAGKEGYAQDLTTTMGAFRISYCTSLVGRFYIGVSGGIDYSGAKYKNSGMADRMNGIQADVESGKPVPGGKMGELYNLWQEGRYDPAKQDPFSNYIATTGDKPNAFNANVGLFAQYDTRDVTFNASKGIFIKAEAKWYPEWLGNTRRTFGRFTLTFDFYQKLWKGAVLACDLYAAANTVTITGSVGGDVYISAENVVIGDGAKIGGRLHCNASALRSVPDGIADSAELYDEPESGDAGVSITVPDDEPGVGSIVLRKALSFAGVLLLAYVLLWLTPLWETVDRKYYGAPFGRYAKAFGIGFAVLAGVPLAAILLFISNVGVRLALIVLFLY